MKYFLYTKFDCNALINNQLVYLNKNNQIEIQGNASFVFFPINQNLKTISFCLSSQEQTRGVKKILFPTYTVFEILAQENSNINFFKTKNLKNGFNVSVLSSPTVFFVENKNKIHSYFSNKQIESCEITDNENMILFEQNKINPFTVCFHKKSCNFFEFDGNSKLEANTLSILSNQNTYAKHGQLKTFNITTNDLELVSTEPVYLDKQPKNVPPFLLHIAFFEAIKEKDFYLAKSYLTSTFANKLNSEHFKEFFGEFDEIKNLVENSEYKIATLKKENTNTFKARVFSLKFENGKISDIIED